MKPLPLTAEMALAAIQGRKMETRRPLNPQPPQGTYCVDLECQGDGKTFFAWLENMDRNMGYFHRAPFGMPGTGLWLREPGRVVDARGLNDEWLVQVTYPADGSRSGFITMPVRLLSDNYLPKWATNLQGIPNGIFREAARFKTVVLAVRVERLWEITEAGAVAEGIKHLEERYINGFWRSAEVHDMERSMDRGFAPFVVLYACLWDRIYGKRPGLAWADNPWVSVTAWDRMVAA